MGRWTSIEHRPHSARTAYPIFERNTGHAASMNLILSLVQTRYLLYIEDDWWAIQASSSVPPAPAGNVRDGFLWRAMNVLRYSTESVAQVSNVSLRKCAVLTFLFPTASCVNVLMDGGKLCTVHQFHRLAYS